MLRGVDLAVARGEMVAIVGASGAGKSTLLHLLGALDRPTAGDVWLDGAPVRGTRPAGARRVRNRSIGFVFQFHHLLREFTALENVMMPLRDRGGTAARGARTGPRSCLREVGLERAHAPPAGGALGRRAAAHAPWRGRSRMIPAVLLADEPSGNLDHANSERLHESACGAGAGARDRRWSW